MDLKDFCFPVSQRGVAVDDFSGNLVDWGDDNTYLTNGYKSIVRDDTNKVISIVKDSYRIIRNETLINELLQFLAASDENFRIDESHSFVQSNRMRLMVTFPNLTLQDSESDINLSLFLHNSYDMSEGVRFYFGAIRAVCTNGMVFGDILGRYYSKHTSGYSTNVLFEGLDKQSDSTLQPHKLPTKSNDEEFDYYLNIGELGENQIKTFNKWIKTYCQYKGWELASHKTNGYDTIKFKK